MTNPSKPAKIAPQPGSATPIYPLSTNHYPLTANHYPLAGPKSLQTKKKLITPCPSRTCREKFRNPMILKNRERRGVTKSCGAVDILFQLQRQSGFLGLKARPFRAFQGRMSAAASHARSGWPVAVTTAAHSWLESRLRCWVAIGMGTWMKTPCWRPRIMSVLPAMAACTA